MNTQFSQDELKKQVAIAATEYVKSGSTIYWNLSGKGIDQNDFSLGLISGSSIVDENGDFEFEHITKDDELPEGKEIDISNIIERFCHLSFIPCFVTHFNASRIIDTEAKDLSGKIFVTSGLGGMSGAQPLPLRSQPAPCSCTRHQHLAAAAAHN